MKCDGPKGRSRQANDTLSSETEEGSGWTIDGSGEEVYGTPSEPEKKPSYSQQLPENYLIAETILTKYNKGYIPKRLEDGAIKVNFNMELYQIIQLNEPQQFLLLNTWMAERWVDNMLGWDPKEFSNISEIMIPFDQIWIPDTTLYNSLSMDDASTRKLLSVKLRTKGKGKGALVELLYPTMYKLSCMLDLRFFPFDIQHCSLTFGSWTYDNTLIDYFPQSTVIGVSNCIENEAWTVLATKVERIVKKYACCPNNYTLLELHLHLQRKPLYYVINLVTPTSIITLISIIGFFSSPSINDLRTEKITLGITTLLSMSIMVFMVADKMPSTSSFIPLIGWFYSAMILLITFGTLAASLVIYIQKRGILGKRPGKSLMKWARILNKLTRLVQPLLMKQAYARKAKEESKRKKSVWANLINVARRPLSMKKTSIQSEKMNRIKTIPLIYEPERRTKSVRLETPLDIISKEDQGATTDDESSYVETPVQNRLSIPKSFTCESFESNFSSSVLNTTSGDLAQLEWDWLAAIMERFFLIFFMTAFVLFSIGTNLIGFLMWRHASREIYGATL